MNRIGCYASVVDGHLEGASVSEIDDSDGIGETEGRLGNGGAGKQVVAMGPCQEFGPHLEVEKASLVRLEKGIGGHEEVESAVEPLACRRMICRIEGRERRVGFDTESVHGGSCPSGQSPTPQIL